MKKKSAWLSENYKEATSKFPERKYPFRTLSDIEADPIYTHDDLEDFDPEKKLGYPGEYPYTRGRPRLDVPGQALDYATVCRFWQRQADQRAL